jgi:hypothetical protein
VITGVLAEVDGDRASVTANLVVTFVDAPDARHTLGQTYAFDAARTDDGWRLASVAVRPVWRDA